MKTRTLKRRVLIREYDFKKVRAQAFQPVGLSTLYDRASFTPVSLDNIEKQQIIDLLKGKTTPMWSDLSLPAIALFNVKDHLYDSRYYNWHVTFDEDGYLCVQARKNTPLSRIGWGIFEKDLTSRI